MKISQESYDYMKNEFEKFFKNSENFKCFADVEKYFKENDAKYKDIAIYCTNAISDNIKLYKFTAGLYLSENINDTHIHTAFKRIFKELYDTKDIK